MSSSPYEHARRPHEQSDASLPVVGLTAAGILALIVAGLLVAWALGAARPGDRRPQWQETFHHGPAAEPDVVREWPALERQWHDHLATYGWVDRQTGVVRIPIAQAMKRLAEPSGAP